MKNRKASTNMDESMKKMKLLIIYIIYHLNGFGKLFFHIRYLFRRCHNCSGFIIFGYFY